MEVIGYEHWFWMLLEDHPTRYVSVVCDGIATVTVSFELNAEENKFYEDQGFIYIRKLASAVLNERKNYSTRRIIDFDDRPDVQLAISTWHKSGKPDYA